MFNRDEKPLPDLSERIELLVGHLTVLAQRMTDGVAPVEDVKLVEDTMLFLAGLQPVLAWEPSHRLEDRKDARAIAEQLRGMAVVGPRPPATVELLLAAADGLTVALHVPVGVEAELLDLERHSRDVASSALDLGRRIAHLSDAAKAAR